MNRALALPLVLVALLAGCAPTPPAPSAAPTTAAPTPTPAATVEPIVNPEPLFDISCDGILPESAYSGLSRAPLTEPAFSSAYYELEYGIPGFYSLAQLQSTQCRWVDETNPSRGDRANLSVIIVPNAAQAWASYLDVYGDSPDFTGMYCNGADEATSRCSWTGLFDDESWVKVVFDGMTNFGSDAKNRANFKTLIPVIRTALENAPTRELWSAPASTKQIATGCPSVLTADAIASVIGGKASDVSFFDDGIGGTDIQFEAERLLHSQYCRWVSPRVESEYGLPYQILRGGEWAWLKARSGDGDIAAGEPLALDGLIDGDSAWLRRGEYVTTADLIVGGNWIAIDVYEEALIDSTLSDEDIATALAQSALTEMYGK